MSSYIPFVNSSKDCNRVLKLYSDAPVIRVSLQGMGGLLSATSRTPKVWIDVSADAFHHSKARLEQGEWWKAGSQNGYLQQFENAHCLLDPPSIQKPNKTSVSKLVRSMLEAARQHNPAWISIPQIPFTSDNERNKVNRALASSAAEWKVGASFQGKLILPAIFTHQRQLIQKQLRDTKLKLVLDCYRRANADGVWVVDSSLNDQEGSSSLDRRFRTLIQFHEALRENVDPSAILIAGPYWGMNLVLWSRGLVSHPAIGLGGPFQYYIPGTQLSPAKARVPLYPLRRLARSGAPLKEWLVKALTQIPQNDPAHKDLATLNAQYDHAVWQPEDGREQTAHFYKKWYSILDSVPQPTRALALYQDLSSAYVVGRSLPDLPKTEGSARRPEKVTQQLMLTCL